MPSIHAILLVALGGAWGAEPQDDRMGDRPALVDPFSAPADFEPGGPRQPLVEANGTAPVTVGLPQPPLPTDYQPPDQDLLPAGAVEMNSGEPNESYAPAAAQWSGAAGQGGAPGYVSQQNGPPQSAVGYPAAAAPPVQRSSDRRMPLSPPSGKAEALPHVLPTVAWPVVVGSLGGVIGLFLIVAWCLKRGAPRAGGRLPREVVEVLGRAPLAEHKQMQLLRLGNKLILIAVTQTGTDTLAEITDPVEVDRLTGLCYQGHPHSSTMAFDKVFKSLETAPKRKGGLAKQRVNFSDLDRLNFDDSSAEPDHVH
jgi:flagellar protein FliO/FliZ